MSENTVRVRFAPSPTGGLHLGGVRTVLFNYLFAKSKQGEFILRIEDTDQTRFVAGAEEYILNCLKWCGITPDEGPEAGGAYGPYRQSERKPIYKQYADQLVAQGQAYLAFDTPEDLENMRQTHKTAENPSPQYNKEIRRYMRNSLTLPVEEVETLLAAGTPYVVRIKMPETDTVIAFHDMIRGDVKFSSNLVDDKVLLKADGMPTYHLAVVVDDYLMKITHAFRGEEWLPSAPVHILLWKWLGWENSMPQWAHLPLILKPDGNGKLSKRDGDRLGFPVFAMNWQDPKTGELSQGFKERGFLPEAFINMLALIGWNDGTGQELFSLEELIEKFSMERVSKAGAKFDFEKAKWFNQEYIKKTANNSLAALFAPVLAARQVTAAPEYVATVCGLIKDRCTYINDFWEQGFFFFTAPAKWDFDALRPKWNAQKTAFYTQWPEQLQELTDWSAASLEASFKALAAEHGMKPGELQLPFRIMLVGGKFGPTVFDIAALIGKEDTLARIGNALNEMNKTS